MSNTPRAYLQGANSSHSMITMTINASFIEYVKATLDGMKDSVKRKTVRRAFAIVGRRLINQGKQNLSEKQHTHNKTPGHVPLMETFQYKVIGFGKYSKHDIKLYAGFNEFGHHSIWADRGIYNHKEEYRTQGNHFWTNVRASAHSVAEPLILSAIDQALGEGINDSLKLRLDGTIYKKDGLFLKT